MNKPQINVTPLIDVLLVLLIIFMVVAPIRSRAFKARVPAEPLPENNTRLDNPDTIVVSISAVGVIRINAESAGGVSDTSKLVTRLSEVFAQRVANGNISGSFADDPGRPFPDRAERTVFVKAPKTVSYGDVARIVDAVKTAGAYPISLQLDNIE